MFSPSNPDHLWPFPSDVEPSKSMADQNRSLSTDVRPCVVEDPVLKSLTPSAPRCLKPELTSGKRFYETNSEELVDSSTSPSKKGDVCGQFEVNNSIEKKQNLKLNISSRSRQLRHSELETEKENSPELKKICKLEVKEFLSASNESFITNHNSEISSVTAQHDPKKEDYRLPGHKDHFEKKSVNLLPNPKKKQPDVVTKISTLRRNEKLIADSIDKGIRPSNRTTSLKDSKSNSKSSSVTPGSVEKKLDMILATTRPRTDELKLNSKKMVMSEKGIYNGRESWSRGKSLSGEKNENRNSSSSSVVKRTIKKLDLGLVRESPIHERRRLDLVIGSPRQHRKDFDLELSSPSQHKRVLEFGSQVQERRELRLALGSPSHGKRELEFGRTINGKREIALGNPIQEREKFMFGLSSPTHRERESALGSPSQENEALKSQLGGSIHREIELAMDSSMYGNNEAELSSPGEERKEIRFALGSPKQQQGELEFCSTSQERTELWLTLDNSIHWKREPDFGSSKHAKTDLGSPIHGKRKFDLGSTVHGEGESDLVSPIHGRKESALGSTIHGRIKLPSPKLFSSPIHGNKELPPKKRIEHCQEKRELIFSDPSQRIKNSRSALDSSVQQKRQVALTSQRQERKDIVFALGDRTQDELQGSKSYKSAEFEFACDSLTPEKKYSASGTNRKPLRQDFEFNMTSPRFPKRATPQRNAPLGTRGNSEEENTQEQQLHVLCNTPFPEHSLEGSSFGDRILNTFRHPEDTSNCDQDSFKALGEEPSKSKLKSYTSTSGGNTDGTRWTLRTRFLQSGSDARRVGPSRITITPHRSSGGGASTWSELQDVGMGHRRSPSPSNDLHMHRQSDIDLGESDFDRTETKKMGQKNVKFFSI